MVIHLQWTSWWCLEIKLLNVLIKLTHYFYSSDHIVPTGQLRQIGMRQSREEWKTTNVLLLRSTLIFTSNHQDSRIIWFMKNDIFKHVKKFSITPYVTHISRTFFWHKTRRLLLISTMSFLRSPVAKNVSNKASPSSIRQAGILLWVL